MMPEEWPIAAVAVDGLAGARPMRAGRLSTVRRDFFLDPARRLSEQERALMTAMLHRLVGDAADAIRAALPSGTVTANDEDVSALYTTLTVSGLLDEPGLMALLLRRADEERIGAAARARSGRREARVLQGLVSHDYGVVAAAAMALILGRGRRRDRFGQSLIVLDDLSAASASIIVHAVAAGLRGDLASNWGLSVADAGLAEAADHVLAQRNEGRSIESLTVELVLVLDEAGSLSDELILAAANEGEIGFVAAVLARRGGISIGSALDELLSGEVGYVMPLLRSCGVSRGLGAGLLAGIGDLLGIDDAGEAIARYDGLTDEAVELERSWLATDPAYRAALERRGQGRG